MACENQSASNKNQYVDEDGALARVRGNKKLYRRMLAMFLETPELDAIEESIAVQDYQKAAEYAHTIKGVTGNLALNMLFQHSSELLRQLRQGTPGDEALAAYRDALAETRVQVESTIARLDREIV